jgi:Holliday junction resolvase YEN1
VAGSSSKDDGNHVVVFKASDFNVPEINLTHGGLILIALLSGGDYHQAGLSGCGPKVAHGLAKCGFGDSLLSAARTLPREDLQEYLIAWKRDLAEELRNNSRGILGRRYGSLSKAIPEEFPNIDILMSYANPVTSETEGKTHRIKATWERPLDLGRIANICELYFEWGVRDVIIKRFRTVIWPAAVPRFLREAVLEKDAQKADRPPLPAETHLSQNEPPSSSPATSTAASLSHLRIRGPPICQDLVVKIHSTRNHDSTDGLLEYRLEVSPQRLVALASAGIKDIRPPLIGDISSSDDTNESDKHQKKPPPDPSSNLRVWVSACIVRAAMPSLIDSFEEKTKRKATKKTIRTKFAGRSKMADTDTSSTPDDVEEPQEREPRQKPNLKAFYPVTKPQKQTPKSIDKPSRDDRSVPSRHSKILSLIDDIVTTDVSKYDGPKAPPVTIANKGGFPTTKIVTPRLVDRGKQSPPPFQVRDHPEKEPEASLAPTPTPSQASTLIIQDPTPDDVIEISSDSDEGEPAPPRTQPKVAPLLVARSRRRAQAQVPDDIIDLT